MITRRFLVTGGALGLIAAVIPPWWAGVSNATVTFAVTHSDAEWRKLLAPDQYAVLRQNATERPFTSPLLHESRHGVFACAGCDLGLFPRILSLTAAPAGQVSGRHWKRPSVRPRIPPSAWCGRRSIAAAAAATW